MLMEHMNGTPLQIQQILDWTHWDHILSRVHQWLLQGTWPSVCTNPEMQLYMRRQHELSVEEGCILQGSRVIIPSQGRQTMIDELHEVHLRVSRMTTLACNYVWWSNMDADSESTVCRCHACQSNQATPATAVLHPWEWPNQAQMRLHVDFCGPVLGKMFLIIIDAYLKWMDPMQSITSSMTVEKFRGIFAPHGIPAVLVIDNWPSLVSVEFKHFVKKNGIKHVITAPHQ